MKYLRNRHVKFYTIGVPVSDGMGGTTKTDVLFHSTLANVMPQKSREVIENMRVEAPDILKINIAFRNGIENSMKVLVVKTDKLYEIVAAPIDSDMKNDSLMILLKESDVILNVV